MINLFLEHLPSVALHVIYNFVGYEALFIFNVSNTFLCKTPHHAGYFIYHTPPQFYPINMHSGRYIIYCKFGNFREGFIFVKLHICKVW